MERLGRCGRWCGLLWAASLWLTACAQPAGLPCAAPRAGEAAVSWQVMVHFREPVPGASEPTLQQLQHWSQGCVQPVSTVSPTLHVYRFTGVASLDVLRQRLQRWPLVQGVQSDGRARPGTSP